MAEEGSVPKPLPAAVSPSTASARMPAITGVKRPEVSILKELKDRIASKEAQLKTKLKVFKDKKKAEITERVSGNLNTININRTAEMTRNLQKMSELLTKVENKASSSQNAASASAVIANAKTAIATAEAAVITQSQKDYTVQATTESKIRVDVKSSRDQLFTDLTAARKLVLDAREALVNAVMAVNTKGVANNGQ